MTSTDYNSAVKRPRLDRQGEKQMCSGYSYGNASFTWTIQRFSTRSEESITSSKFPCEYNRRHGWIMRIYPNGKRCLDEHEGDREYVGCYLQMVERCRDSVSVKYSTYFRDTEGETICAAENVECHLEGGMGVGDPRFIRKSVLVAALKNDELVVHVALRYSFNSISCLDERDSYYIPEQRPAFSLVNDLSSLLASGQHSDITISVDGREIPAHKFILATRSPVFAEMLEGEENRNTSRLEIMDFEYDTVLNMLKFLYSDERIQFDARMAADLIKIADRFELHGMKTYFSNYFIPSINNDNAMELLTLAENFRAAALKKEIIRFIVSHKTTFDFDRYKTELQMCPDSLYEIMRALTVST